MCMQYRSDDPQPRTKTIASVHADAELDIGHSITVTEHATSDIRYSISEVDRLKYAM